MIDLLPADEALIPAERQRHLLERVNRDGRVSSAQAAVEFGVSEDTIRRDLRELAEAGLVERVHGGALRKSQLSHRFETRLGMQQAEKARLASHALSLLRDGMVLLLDQSTTNLMLARQLPAGRSLTVVTPSPDIAVAALDRGIADIVLVGGRLDVQSRSATGAGALEQIGRIRPDMCFLGACAVDIAAGITAMDHDDACLKRAMVAASASIVALVTADKLDTSAAFAVAPYDCLDHMVTQASIPDAARQRYDSADVEIHLV
ncbi:DeoR/GlpR family DNA-binding transcription regulator [Labrys monachus]|uniref:DeoR/GlpR family transcriptional regulator of sugar metabolism n=1 Tax=Labrys monachus TaxID=217067 RepID=A0ABU0FH39_9HYPH|nr:DeoR/GlpR family DNA-binding transcription regulator [Labrys monachus]MDQ0393919.1 DeoR/GlpR family transcriptional regulator of sugar metabolism [Labrys monachus]